MPASLRSTLGRDQTPHISSLGDSRPGWPQHHAVIIKADTRFGIDSYSKLQACQETRAEISQSPVTRPELSIERRPGYLDVGFQGVKPVRQPDVDVEHHASGADRPKGGLAERYGVALQRSVELFVEQNPLLPE